MKSRAKQGIYKRGRYNKALSYLNLQKIRFPEDAQWLDPQIFQCYKSLENYEKAEQLLYEIRSRDDSHLFVYLEMAQMYHNVHEEPKKALLYYDSASKQIIKGYKQEYGNAFALSMDPTTQSETQYDVFLTKAILEYRLRKFRQAKASAGWAHQLRPMKTGAVCSMWGVVGSCDSSVCLGSHRTTTTTTTSHLTAVMLAVSALLRMFCYSPSAFDVLIAYCCLLCPGVERGFFYWVLWVLPLCSIVCL